MGKIDLSKVAKGLTRLFETVMSLKISRRVEIPGVSGEYTYFDPMQRVAVRAKAQEMSQLLLEYIRADLADGKADSCERLRSFMVNEMTRIRQQNGG